MAAEPYDIVVDRNDLANVRIVPASPVAIGADQVHVSIESYALTANNITYGVAGETMKYWNFYPATAGMGRIPVWGFGRVVAVQPAGRGRRRAALWLLAHVERRGSDHRRVTPATLTETSGTARSCLRSTTPTRAWRPIRACRPAASRTCR